MLKTVFRRLGSVKLALALIGILLSFSLLSTLLPQNRAEAFYLERYPYALAALILLSGFHQFFSSALFIGIGGLFFLNLTICTILRVWKEVRGQMGVQIGPDLIHFGVMLLAAGGMVTLSCREELDVYLAEGESVSVGSGIVLTLDSFRYESYRDGRPKEWISTVTARRDGEELAVGYPVEVNKPLRTAGLSVYQVGHERSIDAVLRDPSGRHILLPRGAGIDEEETRIFFMAVEQAGDSPAGVFLMQDRSKEEKETEVSIVPGDPVGSFVLAAFVLTDRTGLSVVRDPGYHVVLAGLLLLALGFAVTYCRRLPVRRR